MCTREDMLAHYLGAPFITAWWLWNRFNLSETYLVKPHITYPSCTKPQQPTTYTYSHLQCPYYGRLNCFSLYYVPHSIKYNLWKCFLFRSWWNWPPDWQRGWHSSFWQFWDCYAPYHRYEDGRLLCHRSQRVPDDQEKEIRQAANSSQLLPNPIYGLHSGMKLCRILCTVGIQLQNMLDIQNVVFSYVYSH